MRFVPLLSTGIGGCWDHPAVQRSTILPSTATATLVLISLYPSCPNSPWQGVGYDGISPRCSGGSRESHYICEFLQHDRYPIWHFPNVLVIPRTLSRASVGVGSDAPNILLRFSGEPNMRKNLFWPRNCDVDFSELHLFKGRHDRFFDCVAEPA